MLHFRSSVLGTLVSGTVLATSLLLTGAKQYEIGSRGFGAAAVAGCTAPTAYETSEWPMFGSITCSGGCTGTNPITNVPDIVGSNALAGPSANDPTYLASAFGTLNAANFSKSVPQYIALTTGVRPTSPISVWVTLYLNSVSAQAAIFGGNTASFYYRVNTTGHQEILKGAVAVLGTGTATLSLSTKYTIGVTLDPATGTSTFYKFSGGTYVTDGTATSGAVSFDNAGTPSPSLWVGQATTEYMDGRILDIGYFNGTWNTTALNAIAAYSQCKAGV